MNAQLDGMLQLSRLTRSSEMAPSRWTLSAMAESLVAELQTAGAIFRRRGSHRRWQHRPTRA